MKSYEIQPTYSNLFETFVKDTIGRRQDVLLFSEILNSINDNCSISLDGRWGSGKTFFVKQVKMFIDSHNEFCKTIADEDRVKIKSLNAKKTEYKPQVCVYYDAWENDNDSDPVLSLIYSIVSNIDMDFSFLEDDDCLKKAASIIEVFTGRNVTGLVENLQGNNLLNEIRKNKDVENTIKQFLDNVLVERGERLIVFIDELDRCKPSYAVRLLERIKHYFSNERITFVFSINAQELQHTIKRYYGNDFDACRYLDRFFDLRITLPDADRNRFYQSINFNDNHYVYDIVCREVINEYNFSLREITKYIRLTKIAAYDPTHESRKYDFNFLDGKAKQFCLMYLVPIMIGLKIYNSSQYDEFISGKNHSPFLAIMNRLNDFIFKEFLSENETFDESETNKTLVKFEDKIEEIYEAIFVKTYPGVYQGTKIGKYSFNAGLKELLLRTTSLLSRYSNIDID